jgi:psiF repeat
MKKIFAALLLALPLMVTPAFAADSPQKTKMASCNQDAAGMKGAERKAFMKSCLKKDGGDAKPAKGAKMKACSADFKATGKPGKERRAFMKDCLKN